MSREVSLFLRLHVPLFNLTVVSQTLGAEGIDPRACFPDNLVEAAWERRSSVRPSVVYTAYDPGKFFFRCSARRFSR